MAIKAPGDIAIVRFPEPDLKTGKPRSVLLIAKVPGRYDDWLLCMISTQLREAISTFDELIDSTQKDFHASGLSVPSVIRIARLAVVPSRQLLGKIGQIDLERSKRIRSRIALWRSPPC